MSTPDMYILYPDFTVGLKSIGHFLSKRLLGTEICQSQKRPVSTLKLAKQKKTISACHAFPALSMYSFLMLTCSSKQCFLPESNPFSISRVTRGILRKRKNNKKGKKKKGKKGSKQLNRPVLRSFQVCFAIQNPRGFDRV